MIGGFWKHSRKMGRSGFHGGRKDLTEKLTRELPQQAAQNHDRFTKDDKEKKAEDISKKDEKVDM